MRSTTTRSSKTVTQISTAYRMSCCGKSPCPDRRPEQGAELTAADIAATLDLYDGPGPEVGTSMLEDRRAGRSTEHDLISGPWYAQRPGTGWTSR